MARVNADKTSTRAASRSGTSTASGAKRKKSAADIPWPDWSALDEEEAAKQGWGVFECIDENTKKIFLIMQAVGKRFKTDQAAIDFVGRRAMVDKDPLAVRAATAVFKSKIGSKAKGK